METREIVFRKYYWRADVDGMKKEGEIYTLLESKGVPNIAPFGKGNDVRRHTTLTHTRETKSGHAGQGLWCSLANIGCLWKSSLGF
jgi:hypothetical protein